MEQRAIKTDTQFSMYRHQPFDLFGRIVQRLDRIGQDTSMGLLVNDR
ncbi:MAG: hypothetical protein R3C02_10820 [Planctomycetaceae bacterium]